LKLEDQRELCAHARRYLVYNNSAWTHSLICQTDCSRSVGSF